MGELAGVELPSLGRKRQKKMDLIMAGARVKRGIESLHGRQCLELQSCMAFMEMGNACFFNDWRSSLVVGSRDGGKTSKSWSVPTAMAMSMYRLAFDM